MCKGKVHQQIRTKQKINKRIGERFKWDDREYIIHEEMRKLNAK